MMHGSTNIHVRGSASCNKLAMSSSFWIVVWVMGLCVSCGQLWACVCLVGSYGPVCVLWAVTIISE